MSPRSRRNRIPTGVVRSSTASWAAVSYPASLVLVGGEPGVGKSTLLLMALGAIAASGRRGLLVTGEESAAQVKLRAARLGGGDGIEILAETELDSVCATLERERPDVCVIDSVQTLYAAELGSGPGSVGQVREAAGRLLRVSKEFGVATIIVGHVTKDGGLRALGPSSTWSMRAAVRGRPMAAPGSARAQESLRLANEIGVFEMRGPVMVEVATR